MTKVVTAPIRTRSGRISKVPERLDPLEDLPEDDYSDDDYETESESEIESDIDLLQTDDEDDFEEDDSDMDENGNLKGFVVEDEEDEE
tara:strand:+ start:4937 stop:5200 length:264 start_codon:yes stop_codon:yes gene_type:complete